jgi:hypothetical protein
VSPTLHALLWLHGFLAAVEEACAPLAPAPMTTSIANAARSTLSPDIDT